MDTLQFSARAAVAILATWVSVFHLGSALGWSLRMVALAFVGGVVLEAVVAIRFVGWGRVVGLRPGPSRLGWSYVLLATFLSALVLVAARPDADDVAYFHDFLLDLRNPGQPMSTSPFVVPFGGSRHEIPGLSETEAYEGMVAALSYISTLEPLNLYHNLLPVLGCFAWVGVSILLFDRFRVRGLTALTAVTASALFLLLDGNLHRSFGNFAFVRLWQGKVLVYSVLLPLFLWACLGYLGHRTRGRLGVLVGLGFCCLAMNRSVFFLLPVFSFAIGVTWVLSFGGWRGGRARHVLAFLGAVLGFALLGLYVAAHLGVVGDTLENGAHLSSVWEARDTAGRSWWEAQQALLFGDLGIPLRDLFLLLVVPWFALSGPWRRLLPILSTILIALTFLPPTGKLWFYLFGNVSWRFYYLLPLPICAGLAAVLFLRRRSDSPRRRKLRVLVGLVALSLTLATFERSTLSADNGVHWKRPFEPRLAPIPLELTRVAAPYLRGQTVLAPNEVAGVLALSSPGDPELVYARRMGLYATEMVIGRCRLGRHVGRRLREDLARADLLILPPCGPRFLGLLQDRISPIRLQEVALPTGGARLHRMYRVLDAHDQ